MSETAEKTTEKKYRSIALASIRRLILLALFIVIATCAAAGISLYRSEMKTYTDFTYSYLDFYGSLVHMMARGNTGEPVILQYIETEELDQYYGEIAMELTAGSAKAGFEDIYIVVPQEDSLLYIVRDWNYDPNREYSDEELAWFENNWYRYSRSYEPGEKEIMMYEMTEPEEGVLYTDLHHSKSGPLATALSPICDYNGNVIALIGADLPLNALYRQIAEMWAYIILAFGLILLVAILIYYNTIRRRIIEPVVKLKKATGQIVQNLSSDREFSVDIHTGDEIEELADSFKTMDQSLHSYIAENTAILKEKARMGTELDLAAVIQQSMLEHEFPPFPDRKEFDIYASMNPAREIGGDFYDFFFTDEDHLAIVIADVAGKGIPAALFMMMSKLIVHNYTMSGMSPKEAMETANEQIVGNNDAEMFVTVWLGILELSTGKITAVNAGHENPVLKKPDGEFEEIVNRHGFVAGVMKGIKYKEIESQIEPGSVLFLYTDGLPEATAADNELFGTQRILSVLNENKEESPEDILHAMDRAVDDFVKDAPQFDDLTMLCIRYYGKDENRN